MRRAASRAENTGLSDAQNMHTSVKRRPRPLSATPHAKLALTLPPLCSLQEQVRAREATYAAARLRIFGRGGEGGAAEPTVGPTGEMTAACGEEAGSRGGAPGGSAADVAAEASDRPVCVAVAVRGSQSRSGDQRSGARHAAGRRAEPRARARCGWDPDYDRNAVRWSRSELCGTSPFNAPPHAPAHPLPSYPLLQQPLDLPPPHMPPSIHAAGNGSCGSADGGCSGACGLLAHPLSDAVGTAGHCGAARFASRGGGDGGFVGGFGAGDCAGWPDGLASVGMESYGANAPHSAPFGYGAAFNFVSVTHGGEEGRGADLTRCR